MRRYLRGKKWKDRVSILGEIYKILRYKEN